MSKLNTQYLIATFMIAFSIYQWSLPDYWEFALYFSAGLAFLVMGLIKNDVFPTQKRLMTILSWLFIIMAGFLLLFLARTDV